MKRHTRSLSVALAAVLSLLGAAVTAQTQQMPDRSLPRPSISAPFAVPKGVSPPVKRAKPVIATPALTSLEVWPKAVSIPVGEMQPIAPDASIDPSINWMEGVKRTAASPLCPADGTSHASGACLDPRFQFTWPEITYTSQNGAVADVSPNGMITAVGTGTTQIKITASMPAIPTHQSPDAQYVTTATSLSQSITVMVTPALNGDGRDLTQWTLSTSTEGPNRYPGYADLSGGVECYSELNCLAIAGERTQESAAMAGFREGGALVAVPGYQYYETIDGGNVWRAGRTFFQDTRWGFRTMRGSVSCWNHRSCVIAGSNGVRRTENVDFSPGWGFEPTWTTPTGAGLKVDGISCASESLCVAVGPNGRVLTSVDRGSTWTTRTSGTSASLIGVSCRKESWCVAVGLNGTIVRSADGRQWTASASGTTNDLFKVACGSQRSCVAVGKGGTLLTSGDRGVTWTVRNTGTTEDLLDVSCPRQAFCMVVGARGVLLRGSP